MNGYPFRYLLVEEILFIRIGEIPKENVEF